MINLKCGAGILITKVDKNNMTFTINKTDHDNGVAEQRKNESYVTTDERKVDANLDKSKAQTNKNLSKVKK